MFCSTIVGSKIKGEDAEKINAGNYYYFLDKMCFVLQFTAAKE